MKKKNRLVLPKKAINQFIEGVDNAPPEGWTEEAKEGARIAASIGHELSDFSDSGDDLEELADIMNLDSPRYDNLKKKG